MLACLLGLFTIPGAGNWYAGNTQAGWGCFAISAFGGILYAASFGAEEEGTMTSFIRYGGLSIAIYGKILDTLTAPGNAEEYNQINSKVVRNAKIKDSGKILIAPGLIKEDAIGLHVAYSF